MANIDEKINFSKPLLNDISLNDVSKELDMMFYDDVKPQNLTSDQCYNEEVKDLIEYLGSSSVPSKLGTDAGNAGVPPEMESLKQQNRNLKQLNIKLESQIASIESEVSVKMKDILKIKMDAENKNRLISALTEENDLLKIKLQSYEMENLQFKTLVEQREEKLNETENLKDELCQTKKHLSSAKNQLTICRKKLASKNIPGKNNDFIIKKKKMESHFYALWKMLLSFAAKLSSAGLLIPEEIALLQNQYQSNLPMLEMKDDDRIKKLLKSFSNSIKEGSTITSKFEDFSSYNSPEAIQKPIVSSSVPSPLSSQPELLATFINSPHEDVFNVSGNIASPSCGITSPSELEVQPTSSIMNVPVPVSTEISAVKPSFSDTKDEEFFTSPVVSSHRDLETIKDKKSFHHPSSPVVSSFPTSLTDLVDSDDGWNELMKTLSIFKNGPLSPFPPSPVKLESDSCDTSTDREQSPVDCLLKRPLLLQSDKIDSGNNVGAVETLDLDTKIAIDQNATTQLSKIQSRKDFLNSPVMQSDSDNDFLNNKKDVSTILDISTAFVQTGKSMAIEIKRGTVDSTVNQLLHLDVNNCVKNQNDVSPLRTETAINEIEQNISMEESVSKSLLLNTWHCNEKETVILPCENAVTGENKQNCDIIANVDIKGVNACDKDGVNKLLSDSEECRNSHRSHSNNSSALAKNEVKYSSLISDIPYQLKKEVFNENKSDKSPSNSTCQNILPPALSIQNVNKCVIESENRHDCSLNTTKTILCNSLTKVKQNLRQSLRLRSDSSKVNNPTIENIDINHSETSTVKNNSIVDYCRARQMKTRFQAKKCLSNKVPELLEPNEISVKPIPIELEDSVPKSNFPAVEIKTNFTSPIKESLSSNLEVGPTATKRLCLRIKDCFSLINNTVKMTKTEKLDSMQRSFKKRKCLVQNSSDINYCETNENKNIFQKKTCLSCKFSKTLHSPEKDSSVEFGNLVTVANAHEVELKTNSINSTTESKSPISMKKPKISETLPLGIENTSPVINKTVLPFPKTEKPKTLLKSYKKTNCTVQNSSDNNYCITRQKKNIFQKKICLPDKLQNVMLSPEKDSIKAVSGGFKNSATIADVIGGELKTNFINSIKESKSPTLIKNPTTSEKLHLPIEDSSLVLNKTSVLVTKIEKHDELLKPNKKKNLSVQNSADIIDCGTVHNLNIFEKETCLPNKLPNLQLSPVKESIVNTVFDGFQDTVTVADVHEVESKTNSFTSIEEPKPNLKKNLTNSKRLHFKLEDSSPKINNTAIALTKTEKYKAMLRSNKLCSNCSVPHCSEINYCKTDNDNIYQTKKCLTSELPKLLISPTKDSIVKTVLNGIEDSGTVTDVHDVELKSNSISSIKELKSLTLRKNLANSKRIHLEIEDSSITMHETTVPMTKADNAIPVELEDSVPETNFQAVEIKSNFTTPIKESLSSNLEVGPTATKRLCLRIRDCVSVMNNTVKMAKTVKPDPMQRSFEIHSPDKHSIVKAVSVEFDDLVNVADAHEVELKTNSITSNKESKSPISMKIPKISETLHLEIENTAPLMNKTAVPMTKREKSKVMLRCKDKTCLSDKLPKILDSPEKDNIVNVVGFEDSVPAADFNIVKIKSFTSIKKPQSSVLNESPTTSKTLPLEIKDFSLVMSNTNVVIPKTEKTKTTLKSIKKKKTKKSKKSKTKKFQNVNKQLKKPCVLQKVVSASSNNAQQDPVTAIFNSIQDKSFTQSCNARDVHSLVNVLINPTYIPDAASLVLRILRHLEKSRKNPLLTFSPNRPSTELLPSSEKCIVLAVFHIEKKNKLHLTGLMTTLVNTIHQIVLSKLQQNPLVLSSFCRLLTEICRQRKNRSVPLSLCCELLKMKHRFASFLIASIVGVWRELLQCLESLPGKEQLYLNALVLGALKQTDRLPAMLQAQSKNALSRLLGDPDVLEVRSTIDFLLICIENQLLEGQIACEQMVSSLVVMATLEEWAWLEDNLINKHIIPNLYEFGVKNKNEPAFAVFCDIYASLFLLCPAQAPENELIKYFDTGAAYVKDCAAIAWAQILLQQKCLLPTSLMHWLEENSTHPRINTIRLFYKRRMMSVRTEIQPEDVIG